MAPFCTLKLILIGESGVGKTSLLQRFVDGIFHEKPHRQTIIDLKVQAIQVEGKLIKLEIWDTAGQERYKAISKEYYRNSDGIILMYDVMNLETYYKVNSWLSDIRSYSDGVTIIVGNKNEDPTSKKVQATVVSTYAKEEGLEFIETSVKTGDNVEKVFQILVRKILEQKYPTVFKSSTVTQSPEASTATETIAASTATETTAASTATETTAASTATETTDSKLIIEGTEVTLNNDDDDDDDDIIRLSETPPIPHRRRCNC